MVGPYPRPVLRTGGQRAGAAPHAVVSAVKSDKLGPAGNAADKFNGGFDGAAAALGKVADTVAGQSLRHDAGYLGSKLDPPGVGHIGGMHQLRQLFFDGLYDPWMSAPHGVDGNPGRNIDKEIAVGVFHVAPMPSSYTHGKLPAPRAIDSYLDESSSSFWVFGPGTLSVTILGAPG